MNSIRSSLNFIAQPLNSSLSFGPKMREFTREKLFLNMLTCNNIILAKYVAESKTSYKHVDIYNNPLQLLSGNSFL